MCTKQLGLYFGTNRKVGKKRGKCDIWILCYSPGPGQFASSFKIKVPVLSKTSAWNTSLCEVQFTSTSSGPHFLFLPPCWLTVIKWPRPRDENVAHGVWLQAHLCHNLRRVLWLSVCRQIKCTCVSDSFMLFLLGPLGSWLCTVPERFVCVCVLA